MKYIISCITILLTFLIIYYINLKFEPRQSILNIENNKLSKINILSDCIVILTRKNCPYCTILEEKIKKSNKKFTNVSFNMDRTFDFDNTFTNLDINERKNITDEVQKFLEPGQFLVFPTIIVKDKLYFGLQKDEILSDIFDFSNDTNVDASTETDTITETNIDT
jgi:thioredoxin-related protein